MKLLIGKNACLIGIVFISMLAVGCSADTQPKIAQGVDGCSSCGMIIDKINEASGYYLDKEFKPFCSVGCLLRSYEARRKQHQRLPDRVYFADYLGGGFLPSDSTTFLLTKHIRTVMGWGIIGFADPDSASEHKQHDDEMIVDWVELRTVRGEPDRTISLVFTMSGMIPEVAEIEKGELIEWEIEGRQLEEDLLVQVRGYEELGEIVIPASGDIIRVRMLAVKPGAGFPLVRSGSEEVLGRIRVSGFHTPEEEEM
ncbi:MAG: hypothetical protein GTO51_03245 [Candidatus Latescibacteria bacterium]|nr:hypothetical protein [Candidatus Latescibacterota bacterium]NIM22701.1 hypothetical protein [Candidatus Latescibacterota bacterium]NIM64990.1 hypothetical protein [Candidatus Latescibacterota bacterium]NIO01505.1 hypothetical protein [Candidatus Latescibacterota bacterium]NIO28014.1 hypothetical protein [Candidatus Latescibacterota bacterium]